MAHLFKPTYSKVDPATGEKKLRRLRKWYGTYKDADGKSKRVPLCEDKSAAQAMLVEIMRKVERQAVGLVDPATD